MKHTVKIRSFKDFMGRNYTWKCSCGAQADFAWFEDDKAKCEADAARHAEQAAK